MNLTKEMSEGWAANERGLQKTRNPYPFPSPQWHGWLDGWFAYNNKGS